MFRVNRQTDYAIRVILALAKQPEGTRLSTGQIGQEMLIPKTFLPRIVARLAQNGLIKTFPGRDGGLMLSRTATAINLLDVMDAFEGAMLLSECMLGEQACPFEDNCPVRKRWTRLQNVIANELAQTSFYDLAQEAKGQDPTTLLRPLMDTQP